MKLSPYDLRAARKRAGLTLSKVSAVSGVRQKTWETWEASPGASHSARTPEYAFRFLRCYEILKRHNLLSELFEPEE
jgi:transcriptional regulator with XRE-family HTH domain